MRKKRTSQKTETPNIPNIPDLIRTYCEKSDLAKPLNLESNDQESNNRARRIINRLLTKCPDFVTNQSLAKYFDEPWVTNFGSWLHGRNGKIHVERVHNALLRDQLYLFMDPHPLEQKSPSAPITVDEPSTNQENSQNVPRTNQDVPRTTQDVPRTTQDVPRTNQDVPRTTQDVPRTNQDVPRESVSSQGSTISMVSGSSASSPIVLSAISKTLQTPRVPHTPPRPQTPPRPLTPPLTPQFYPGLSKNPISTPIPQPSSVMSTLVSTSTATQTVSMEPFEKPTEVSMKPTEVSMKPVEISVKPTEASVKPTEDSKHDLDLGSNVKKSKESCVIILNNRVDLLKLLQNMMVQ